MHERGAAPGESASSWKKGTAPRGWGGASGGMSRLEPQALADHTRHSLTLLGEMEHCSGSVAGKHDAAGPYQGAGRAPRGRDPAQCISGVHIGKAPPPAGIGRHGETECEKPAPPLSTGRCFAEARTASAADLGVKGGTDVKPRPPSASRGILFAAGEL